MAYRYREAKVHAVGDSTAARLAWVLDTLDNAYNQFVWPYLERLDLGPKGIVEFLRFRVDVERSYAFDLSTARAVDQPLDESLNSLYRMGLDA